MTQSQSFSLMVHGGAGAFENLELSEETNYRESVRRILECGREILKRSGSAMQTVEVCASLLENNPLFNAGYGSVLNAEGCAEMDAAIMDGRDLSAGAVAAIGGVANPVRLARRILNASGHVMLVGEGAQRFAEQSGIPRVAPEYFLIPESIARLEKARRHSVAQSDAESGVTKLGTIGAVARDLDGNLAAATSTGGIVNKRPGRVGDSPLIGAGVYADNESCAVSATGRGEDFMRTALCKMIADYIFLLGKEAENAAETAIDYLGRRVDGRGGVIVIDRLGRCAARFNTAQMIHGWIQHGGETIVRF
ncbi:MAG: isoaspartyl peptidase/L-asparaginase family protein [Gammaproteobacteria bacterium]